MGSRRIVKKQEHEKSQHDKNYNQVDKKLNCQSQKTVDKKANFDMVCIIADFV